MDTILKSPIGRRSNLASGVVRFNRGFLDLLRIRYQMFQRAKGVESGLKGEATCRTSLAFAGLPVRPSAMSRISRRSAAKLL